MSVSSKDRSVHGTRRPLGVLLVEDSEPDAILMMHVLDRGGFDTTWERVDTAQAMADALKKRDWDLILADHSMPNFSAPAALELLKRNDLDIPFIIVSGHIDEETAVEAMRAGAHDYIMKDRLARLLPAVERELREAHVRRELRRAHEDLEVRVEKRTADLKAANLKLQKVLEERRRLENELLEIAENERRRIGFDLHDDLGQKLTGISMMIAALEHKLAADGDPSAPEARKIHSLIDEAMHHTHDLAHNFSSLDVRGDDLASLLKALAENVKKTFAIPCVFGAKGMLPELAQDTTMQLYKIAQESISNAIKHGKATQVSIGVARNTAKLVLTIQNDGLPFSPPAQPTKRMGLRIMNYRANTIGATLQIEPNNNSGTVVTCEVPIKNGSKPTRRKTETRACLV